jgi:hypothetical protein
MISAILLLLPATSMALPTQVVHQDVDHCDPLFVPQNVHELGIAPTFATLPDELIEAADTITELIACPGDSPDIPNALVIMTNLTGKAWSDVWYVADPPTQDPFVATSISNFDGLVDTAPGSLPGRAFKIDTVGVNTPLIFESIAFNDIFEPGETWHFIIDDYMNTAGLPPSLFDSLGVASTSAGGPPSSGSIIAIEVPEPGGFALLAVGLVVAAIARRSAQRRKR